jgi:hypothetical protein
MATANQMTGYLGSTISLILWTLTAATSSVVFGVLYAAAIQVLAASGVMIYLALVLGAYAGAIGGPVFGAAYWALIVRRGWPSRLGAAVCAGVLGAVIYAAIGIGFIAWEASERAHQPTRRPVGANPNAAVAERRGQAHYSGGVIEATLDGGQVIEQPARSPNRGRSANAVFTTAGVTGAGGLLYGVIFGAMFGGGHNVKRSEPVHAVSKNSA